MKIAVPFDNESIYSDFGTSKQFKIFDVRDNKIQDSSIIDTKGIKFGALAVLLNEKKVNLVLLDQISKGSASALTTNNIRYVAGLTGNVDEQVKEYLSENQ